MKTALFIIFWVCAGQSFAWIKVVEDTPHRLILNIKPDNIRYKESGGNLSVYCDNCISSGVPGSADLPYIPINIIGETIPSIIISIKKSTGYTSQYPLRSRPFNESLHKLTYKKNALLFNQARFLKSIIGPVQKVRNIPTRTILIPMATWDDNKKKLVLIDSASVKIAFLETNQRSPSKRAINMPKLFLRDYLNVNGARVHSTILGQAPGSLRKTARKIKVNLNKDLIKIAVGDRNPESLAEDGIYKVTYETLKDFADKIGKTRFIIGNPVTSIKIYTGGEKKLDEIMDTLPGPGNLREIPIEVVDTDDGGTFDEGDYILFFGHGTSVYNKVSWDFTANYPIHYEFESNPYSFENYYYLDFSDSGKRLKEISSGNSSGTPITFFYSYHRKEKDILLGFCDPSKQLDVETGRNWYWILIDKEICKTGKETVNIPSSQLEYQTSMLEGYKKGYDTYFGLYRVGIAGVSNVYNVTIGSEQLASIPSSLPFYGQYYIWDQNLEDNSLNIEWTDGKNNPGFDGYTVVYSRDLKYYNNPFLLPDFEL